MKITFQSIVDCMCKTILVLAITLAIYIVIGGIKMASAEEGITTDPLCLIETDKPQFVTTVSNTKGEELIRYGTCDAGDPINIEYVDRVVVKTETWQEYYSRKTAEDLERYKKTDYLNEGGGDRNYPAILEVKRSVKSDYSN